MKSVNHHEDIAAKFPNNFLVSLFWNFAFVSNILHPVRTGCCQCVTFLSQIVDIIIGVECYTNTTND